ncbi:MAG TPA: DUF393 domain-containing protein [Burkholderiales bacterium]|nr:DUF393 domain-containing protein [Burkholderiales bacterium]
MSPAIHFPITIYYDASCPLCANEMHTLKATDVDNKMLLVDCSAPNFDGRPFAKDGITVASMLGVIHARDASGHWFKGVDVFEIAYDAAGLSALAALWRHSKLRPLWNRAYPWVARNRHALSRFGIPRLVAGALRLLARGVKRSAAKAAVAATQGCNAEVCTRDQR